MRTYAVRATKEEKNLYYILFMHDMADENYTLFRVVNLLEKSYKSEFDNISFWPLKTDNEVLESNVSVKNHSPNFFFLKKTDKKQWEHYVDVLLCDHYTITTDETVIV